MADHRVQIRVFPVAASSSGCDPNSGTCDCGTAEDVELIGGRHPNEVLDERLTELRGRLGDLVSVEVANYGSNSAIYAGIDQLNAALIASGKDFMVSPTNFFTFISTLAPVVIVEDQIRFTRSVPDLDSLLSAVEQIPVSG